MMMTNIEKTLDLEEIDEPLLYRSKQLWLPIGARGVFGGQVIGLALNAAMKTVDESFQVHSLHCYFLLPGNEETCIVAFILSSSRVGCNLTKEWPL